MKKANVKILSLAALFLYGGLLKAQEDSLKSKTIEEVVLTAYGIKKERKSLGYVYQDISGDAIKNARETNVTNSLVGKVTGLQLVKSTMGPAASSKIILRGYNSITGDNQPLIVVDGIPLNNFLGTKNNDFWNPDMDMGNGLSDINPEDIENVSVLKGGAASALYGSRAGNGVIMITTKSGKRGKGAGITYSNTLTISDLFMTPDVQDKFSQGNNGEYGATSSASWGALINGQKVTDWQNREVGLSNYNNLRNFFNTGISNLNTLTFQNSLGENSQLFSSVSYLSDNSIIPESKYKRLNFTTRVSSQFGENKRWNSDLKFQYINSESSNRPISGGNNGNYYSTLVSMPSTVNILDLKSGMDVLGAKQNWYIKDGNNPYWNVYNRLNNDFRNRFLVNANLRYSFTDWLNANAQVGSDMYFSKFEQKVYSGGNIDNQYSTGQDRSFENNYILSLNAKKDNIVGKWGGSLSVFGQIMKMSYNKTNIGGVLAIPNYFVVKNIKLSSGNVNEDRTEKQINSAFATGEINYDGYWFLNGTFRNDWASTLIESNRSYQYYSASTSLVITDMIKKLRNTETLGNFLTFAKIRASFAQTGNSLDPYKLHNIYNVQLDPNGNFVANSGDVLFDPNVVSEKLSTYEFGTNLRFFNRIDLDVNYYNTKARNQLLELPLNDFSGYKRKMINAGEISNEGIEVMLGADIVKNNNFTWNAKANFSKNINKINNLDGELKTYLLPNGGFDAFGVYANVGSRYGVLMGTSYQRVEDPTSEFFGKIIVDNSGLPMANSTPKELGDQTPRAIASFINTINYKNFTLSFQVDGRFGGKFFSGTQHSLAASGRSARTVVNGGREDFIVDGVLQNGNTYTANKVAVSPENYWAAVTSRGSSNLGINEAFIYDATNIRLRNVSVSYNIPKTMLERTFIQNARLTLSANNVWMIHSKADGIDPESSFAVNTNASGFEYFSFPTSRSFNFNLTVGF